MDTWYTDHANDWNAQGAAARTSALWGWAFYGALALGAALLALA